MIKMKNGEKMEKMMGTPWKTSLVERSGKGAIDCSHRKAIRYAPIIDQASKKGKGAILLESLVFS